MSAMAEELRAGMVALVPDERSRAALALAADSAEPPEDLHLTLTYLGDDAVDMPDERRLALLTTAITAAGLIEPVTGRAFAHATFNPDGNAGRTPCAVYLIGDSDLIDGLRTMFSDFSDGQHAPYIPHVTAGYGLVAADLDYTGPVTFDAVRVALGETSTDIALTGRPAAEPDEQEQVVEIKRAVSDAKRTELAKGGRAMPDGAYPMETIGDLHNAIQAYGRCPKEEQPALRRLIMTNARRLKVLNMIPKDWSESKSLNPHTADDFTAGVLLGLASLLEADVLELKAGPPGHTYPSPDPGAARLRAYWTRGEGATKIKWGAPGDFKRCVKHLRGKVGARAEGLCFTGDTEFLTRSGVTTFAEAVDTDVLVLTSEFSSEGGYRRNGRWTQAPVRSFGEHRVLSVTLRRNKLRKVVRVTPNHRWFASLNNRSTARHRIVEVTTDQLRPGMALAALTPHNTLRDLRPSPFGIAAGITFGDGHREVGRGARLDLWGSKDAALLPYFAGCTSSPIKNINGTLGVRVSGLPGSWKQYPLADEGTAYLLGWLAGYLAADGTVNKVGSVFLDCHDRDTMVFVRDLALRLGIATFAVREDMRTVSLPYDSPLNGMVRPMYRITFDRSGFPAQALLIPEHRRRFEAAPVARSRMRWTVESVKDHSEVEEVFCVDVPGTHTFALADHIWVANCNIYHRSALGVAPGQEHKGGPLWVVDAEAPGGWRADYPAWQLDLPDEVPQPATEEKARPAYAEMDDDEVLRHLDDFAAMSDSVAPIAEADGDIAPGDDGDTEEIYDEGIASDIDWQLQPDGTLSDPETGDDGDTDSPASLFDWMQRARAAT